jgi:transcriptional regulator with PAS, ATPase and Fis domain
MLHHALITGPDPAVLLHLRTLLGGLGYSVETTPPDAPPTRAFSVAVIDIRRRPCLHRLKALAARGLILALCADGQQDLACFYGADEVFTCPAPTADDLAALIAQGKRRLGRPLDGPFGQIIGRSPGLCQVLSRIERCANSQTTVLVTGPTGTGKELIARALHQSGARREGPFIAVNCAAIPENLAESEIFGYARGAFTGASAARPGRLAAAEGGTLFLDEIGELSLPLQAKLLRVLQEREYTPIGENLPRRANVRVIAATNRDLQGEVQGGRFRADLYWRLEVMTIELPSLAQRMEDVLPLTYHTIDRTNQSQKCRVLGFTARVEDMLLSHDWPGNVRELENTIERAVILRGEGDLREEDIILRRGPSLGHVLEAVRLPPDGLDLQEITAALETLLIRQALAQSGGNRTVAARLLNINRSTLLEKLRRRDVVAR